MPGQAPSVALPPYPPQFAGEAEHTLTASVELIATTRERKPWSRPPLSMSFQVGVDWLPFFLWHFHLQWQSLGSRPPLSVSFQVRRACILLRRFSPPCCSHGRSNLSTSARLLTPAPIIHLTCFRGSPPANARSLPASLAHRAQVPMHSASGVKVQYLKVWEKVRRAQ